MVSTIIDISFVVIALIALIIGIARGFIKQLNGLLNGLVALALSIFATYMVFNAIKNMDFILSFKHVATGWFKKEVFTTTVASADELATLLAGGGFWALLAGSASGLYNTMTTISCNTLGGLFGHYVATAIICAILWLILFIVIKLIILGISKLLEKLSKLPVLNAIDRILGGIWSLALTYVIMVGLALTLFEIVVMKFMPSSQESLFATLAETKIISLLNNSNILGNLLAGLLQAELPVF